MFSLDSITHDPDAKPPLTASFTLSGETHELRVDAKDVQTFRAFQRVAANALGVWVDNPYTCSAKQARQIWEREVSLAFDAGRTAG